MAVRFSTTFEPELGRRQFERIQEAIDRIGASDSLRLRPGPSHVRLGGAVRREREEELGVSLKFIEGMTLAAASLMLGVATGIASSASPFVTAALVVGGSTLAGTLFFLARQTRIPPSG